MGRIDGANQRLCGRVQFGAADHSPSRRPGTLRQAFGRLQLLSAAFMAFSHGSNDGQKFIGVFTLALVLGGVLSSLSRRG